jgi:hypothetical protein
MRSGPPPAATEDAPLAQRTEQLVVQMQRRIERLGYKVTLEPHMLVGA